MGVSGQQKNFVNNSFQRDVTAHVRLRLVGKIQHVYIAD
jgi:hypothetical protein